METLMEFRAGKMVLEGEQVRADPRKGLFRIARGIEGLVHVQWLDRVSNALEDDQIVFPDEAVFEKVRCSSGRVYILKFNTDDRKFFFWLQEPSPDGDEQICSSVNCFINLSPVEGDEEGTDVSTATAAAVPVATPSGTEAADPSYQPVQLGDLQRILSTLGQGSNTASMFTDPGPSLSEVLTPDNVLPLIENCHLDERLSAYLPEGDWTPAALADLIQSPQFRQQMDMFTHALRTGQMDVSQFGIDPSQCDFTVASFLEAIEKLVATKGVNDEADRPKRDVDDMDE